MKSDTPRTDIASFSYDTFHEVDPWKGERYIKVVPAKLAAELEREGDQLKAALLAMREYSKEHIITGRLYKQVEAALSLSNVKVEAPPSEGEVWIREGGRK